MTWSSNAGLHGSHGGKDVSGFVSQHLHDLIETVDPSTAAAVVDWTIDRHAGYFRRWKGGALQNFIDDVKAGNEKRTMTLEERLTLAYLTVSLGRSIQDKLSALDPSWPD